MTTAKSVEFELEHPSFGYAMSVGLHDLGGRWVAVAQGPDGRLLGIGATAREAFAVAIAPLGAHTAALLMADPALFGASLRVLAA
ncbi:MAG TPA: hypothetical protein VL687_04215 [Methylomirabilota bacterium]|nr:hypothetical protein [Methylomirabilota bacterium]